MIYGNLKVYKQPINTPTGRVIYDFKITEEQNEILCKDDVNEFKNRYESFNELDRYSKLFVLKRILELSSYKILNYLNNKKELEKFSFKYNDEDLSAPDKYSSTIYQELYLCRDYINLSIMINLQKNNLDIIEFFNHNDILGYDENFKKYKYYVVDKYYYPRRVRNYNNLIGMCLNRILVDFKEQVDFNKINNELICELKHIWYLLQNINVIYNNRINKDIIIEKHIYNRRILNEIKLKSKCDDLKEFINSLSKYEKTEKLYIIINILNNILYLYEK